MSISLNKLKLSIYPQPQAPCDLSLHVPPNIPVVLISSNDKNIQEVYDSTTIELTRLLPAVSNRHRPPLVSSNRFLAVPTGSNPISVLIQREKFDLKNILNFHMLGPKSSQPPFGKVQADSKQQGQKIGPIGCFCYLDMGCDRR
jgi:hypothetical protein